MTFYDHAINRARLVIRTSKVAPEMEAQLRSDRGGRPRRLTVDSLFAACVVVASPDYNKSTLVGVHDLLTKHLSLRLQLELGVAWREPNSEIAQITIRQVRYLFKTLIKKADYSAHTGRLNWKDLTQTQRQERERAFIEHQTRMIQASIAPAGATSATCLIDGTAIESHTRSGYRRPRKKADRKKEEEDFKTAKETEARKSKAIENYQLDGSNYVERPYSALDRDAMFGYKTPTNRSKHRISFGHSLIASSTSYAPGSDRQSLKLVNAITLVPANSPDAEPTVRMIDAISKQQHVEQVIVDRAFSMSQHDRWAAKLLDRDIDQIFDLRDDQRGTFLDLRTGALMIDGYPHVPWTPKHLHNIERPARYSAPRPTRSKTPEKQAAYHDELATWQAFMDDQAELELYALRPNGNRKPDGSRHFFTNSHGRENATPTQLRTKGDVKPELRQRLRWGSPAWIREYGRRSGIEGVFGNLKTKDGEGVGRGWIRVVGLAATSLMLTFAVISYNIRMLRKWAVTNDRTHQHALLHPDTRAGARALADRLDEAIEPPD